MPTNKIIKNRLYRVEVTLPHNIFTQWYKIMSLDGDKHIGTISNLSGTDEWDVFFSGKWGVNLRNFDKIQEIVAKVKKWVEAQNERQRKKLK